MTMNSRVVTMPATAYVMHSIKIALLGACCSIRCEMTSTRGETRRALIAGRTSAMKNRNAFRPPTMSPKGRPTFFHAGVRVATKVP